MASSADRRTARPYQDQRTCTQHGAFPGTVCRVSGTRSEEKEDLASLKDNLGLWFFFSLPSIILASSWSIKGKVGHPTKETDQLNTPRITSHIAEQRPSSQHPFDLFHQRLPLSLVRPSPSSIEGDALSLKREDRSVHSDTTTEPLGSNLEHMLEHLAHSGAPVTLGPSDQSLTRPLAPPSFSLPFVTPQQTSSTWT